MYHHRMIYCENNFLLQCSIKNSCGLNLLNEKVLDRDMNAQRKSVVSQKKKKHFQNIGRNTKNGPYSVHFSLGSENKHVLKRKQIRHLGHLSVEHGKE